MAEEQQITIIQQRFIHVKREARRQHQSVHHESVPDTTMIFAWNCLGIGRPASIRTLRVFINTQKPQMVFLSELRSSSHPKIQRLGNSLGFQHHDFVPSVGRSGGLVMCWKGSVDFKVISSNSSMITGMVFSHPPQSPWSLIAVYGPTSPSLKHIFWDQLIDTLHVWRGPCLLMGDFNSILEQ